ncbi:MAG: heptaprenyl diphosphate synthase [Verrucomicrobiales bacterium]
MEGPIPTIERVSTTSPLEQVPTLANDLTRVEEQLHVAVATDNALLQDIASHLISAGGKRVRPGFCITSAAAASADFAPAEHEIILGAVAVELVHQGSLYHDDVMDSAETRRTVKSVNAKWGNHQAILAGDFLLGRASEIAASLGVEVAGLLARTISRLCDGQVRELEFTYRIDRTEESYLKSIDGKTASLLAAACRIGGIVGGLDRDRIDHLTTFGRAYGMAFQVVDDILDLTATDEELGKPAGNDLIEGVYTLPVIRAMAHGEVGADLQQLLGRPIDATARDEARELVKKSGGLKSAHADARRYADEANDALHSFGNTAGGTALKAAADHLVDKVENLVV